MVVFCLMWLDLDPARRSTLWLTAFHILVSFFILNAFNAVPMLHIACACAPEQHSAVPGYLFSHQCYTNFTHDPAVYFFGMLIKTEGAGGGPLTIALYIVGIGGARRHSPTA